MKTKITIKKEGDLASLKAKGSPISIVEAIALTMLENDQWAAMVLAAAETYKNEKEVSKCPECLEYASQDELDVFGGMCEHCGSES